MIMKSITQTPAKEIMQIITQLRNFVGHLRELPTRHFFGELINLSEKKIAFLEDFLEKRAEKTKQKTMTAYKEIHCIACQQDFEIPLKAVLSSTGYVRYFRDDQPHECPDCGWREVEGQGIIIIRFDK